MGSNHCCLKVENQVIKDNFPDSPSQKNFDNYANNVLFSSSEINKILKINYHVSLKNNLEKIVDYDFAYSNRKIKEDNFKYKKRIILHTDSIFKKIHFFSYHLQNLLFYMSCLRINPNYYVKTIKFLNKEKSDAYVLLLENKSTQEIQILIVELVKENDEDNYAVNLNSMRNNQYLNSSAILNQRTKSSINDNYGEDFCMTRNNAYESKLNNPTNQTTYNSKISNKVNEEGTNNINKIKQNADKILNQKDKLHNENNFNIQANYNSFSTNGKIKIYNNKIFNKKHSFESDNLQNCDYSNISNNEVIDNIYSQIKYEVFNKNLNEMKNPIIGVNQAIIENQSYKYNEFDILDPNMLLQDNDCLRERLDYKKNCNNINSKNYDNIISKIIEPEDEENGNYINKDKYELRNGRVTTEDRDNDKYVKNELYIYSPEGNKYNSNRINHPISKAYGKSPFDDSQPPKNSKKDKNDGLKEFNMNISISSNINNIKNSFYNINPNSSHENKNNNNRAILITSKNNCKFKSPEKEKGKSINYSYNGNKFNIDFIENDFQNPLITFQKDGEKKFLEKVEEEIQTNFEDIISSSVDSEERNRLIHEYKNNYKYFNNNEDKQKNQHFDEETMNTKNLNENPHQSLLKTSAKKHRMNSHQQGNIDFSKVKKEIFDLRYSNPSNGNQKHNNYSGKLNNKEDNNKLNHSVINTKNKGNEIIDGEFFSELNKKAVLHSFENVNMDKYGLYKHKINLIITEQNTKNIIIKNNFIILHFANTEKCKILKISNDLKGYSTIKQHPLASYDPYLDFIFPITEKSTIIFEGLHIVYYSHDTILLKIKFIDLFYSPEKDFKILRGARSEYEENLKVIFFSENSNNIFIGNNVESSVLCTRGKVNSKFCTSPIKSRENKINNLKATKKKPPSHGKSIRKDQLEIIKINYIFLKENEDNNHIAKANRNYNDAQAADETMNITFNNPDDIYCSNSGSSLDIDYPKDNNLKKKENIILLNQNSNKNLYQFVENIDITKFNPENEIADSNIYHKKTNNSCRLSDIYLDQSKSINNTDNQLDLSSNKENKELLTFYIAGLCGLYEYKKNKYSSMQFLASIKINKDSNQYQEFINDNENENFLGNSKNFNAPYDKYDFGDSPIVPNNYNKIRIISDISPICSIGNGNNLNGPILTGHIDGLICVWDLNNLSLKCVFSFDNISTSILKISNVYFENCLFMTNTNLVSLELFENNNENDLNLKKKDS